MKTILFQKKYFINKTGFWITKYKYENTAEIEYHLDIYFNLFNKHIVRFYRFGYLK
jgi:hypothetical protein